MVRDEHGNLLEAEVDALVNTVNTVGVMGKGIALQFKRAFPGNFKAYKRACDAGEVQLGRMFVWDAGSLGRSGPRYVVNFPTKGHWKARSRLADIDRGLEDLVSQIRLLDIKRIALPPLGCGNGGLLWSDVRPRIVAAFAQIPDVEVLLYSPEGAPAAADQPVRSDPPRMSPGRAALIAIMDRYLPYAVVITSVDIQKLMYFTQEAGEPLNLRYAKDRYGPYADNLRHVLNSMEGHFIRGTGDGTAKALDALPFELTHGTAELAANYLAEHPETTDRVDRVMRLVEGFESTYGLELLATVHWAATRGENGSRRPDPVGVDDVTDQVRKWNRRKGQLFKPAHVETALERLRSLGWLAAPPATTLFNQQQAR